MIKENDVLRIFSEDIVKRCVQKVLNVSSNPVKAQSDGTADRNNSTSDIVADDGSVTYKGKSYQLYRRYTGKAVVFTEKMVSCIFL